jgi:hypothetical protein
MALLTKEQRKLFEDLPKQDLTDKEINTLFVVYTAYQIDSTFRHFITGMFQFYATIMKLDKVCEGIELIIKALDEFESKYGDKGQ